MLFYKCNLCGNFVVFVENKRGGDPVCCGEEMVRLTPNTTDAATEKHVPAVTIDGNIVKVVVGDVEHPMLEEHHISFIVIETNQGFHKKDLTVGEAPAAEFALTDGEKAVAVYEYCNLHGLWKKDL